MADGTKIAQQAEQALSENELDQIAGGLVINFPTNIPGFPTNTPTNNAPPPTTTPGGPTFSGAMPFTPGNEDGTGKVGVEFPVMPQIPTP